MRKLTTMLVLLLFAGLQVAFAQRTVTGRVTKAQDNTALPGVTVVVIGTPAGTLTDADGRYSIPVPNDDAVLRFSFIGFTPKDVTVGSQTTVDVALEESVLQMGEVVVTALGIRRESKKLGYAVTAVNTEEILKNKTTNMMESLEGKVSGLNITAPAAGAGSSTQLRLRGQVAFTGANNAPLIVLNGLPMDQRAQSTDGYGTSRDLGDFMNTINPSDIESMTILKGATAAALYGSRAANGAIIITTKSGQRGQAIGVEFSSSITVQEVLDFFEFQKVYGMGVAGTKPVSPANATTNGQFSWGAKYDGQPVPAFDGSMIPYEFQENRLKDYFNTGTVFDNTLSFSGGNEKGSFRASFGRTDTKGIEPTNEYKRNIANLGVVYDITKKVNFSMNVNYSNENYINPPQIGTQGEGSMNFLTRVSLTLPLSVAERSAINPATGTEWQIAGWTTINNPYYMIQAGQSYIRTRDRFMGTATLRYDITDWLYAQGRFNYDYLTGFNESKRPGGIGTSQPQETDGTWKGTYSVFEAWETNINADYLVGASKKFGKFSVDASFGGNTFRVKDHRFDISATHFTVRDLYSIANGVTKTQSFDFSQYRVNSLYGLAELGYNDMLYLNFTGREDWFSVLNPQNNSKFYSSVSGSFIFSELLKGQSWLSYGKLRGSWAQVGSANGVNTYEGNLTYSIANNQFNGQTTASIAGSAAPNPNLQPFTVTEKEIGLEVRLFNNRLHFDVAAFDKLTTDQVLSVQLSTASGYSTSKKNLGSLKNKGIEFMIEYTPIETRNFRWTTSWNNAYLKTEVLSVGVNPDGTPIDQLLVLNFNTTGMEFLGSLYYTVGMPMNQLYTKTYLRNDNGDILVKDNGRLNASADYVPVGSSIPKHTGGWNNTFAYKNLTLGVFIDYKFGGTVLSSTLLNMTRQGLSMLSLEGRREGENGLVFPGVYQSSGLPNTTAVTDLQGFYGDYRNLQIGDPFTFKSDFVKLRSVSLSYDLTSAFRKVNFLGFVRGLMLTASCRNVAIFYKDIPNLDPEAIQSSGDTRAGYENSSLPTTRNYMFSLNVKF
ncbi:MAG: SusC/RagA family TonB-linked outer membrane protein [Bacteroidetes bacterium RBG_19FT_COMBO_42_7]|nr:MAG: SusC/RagA family TonB-linked outer membrane protein [Bacteroidetes bacterium RBG_19FT_COMBO_42_7]